MESQQSHFVLQGVPQQYHSEGTWTTSAVHFAVQGAPQQYHLKSRGVSQRYIQSPMCRYSASNICHCQARPRPAERKEKAGRRTYSRNEAAETVEGRGRWEFPALGVCSTSLPLSVPPPKPIAVRPVPHRQHSTPWVILVLTSGPLPWVPTRTTQYGGYSWCLPSGPAYGYPPSIPPPPGAHHVHSQARRARA